MPEGSVSEPTVSSPRKRRLGAGNFGLAGLVILAILAFAWAEKARRDTVRQLEQTSAQFEEYKKSTQDSSQEAAARVRENVARLINIPLEPAPTVATISDINRLRESNEFFNVAENGDYLVLTGNRAILYDLDRNIILDVAPFRVNRPEAGSPSVSPSPTTAKPSPTPRSTP